MSARGQSAGGLRPLRLSLGNAPPFDVPARFIALGGTALLAGCVLIAVGADRLVAPGGWDTPEALGITHILALGFVTAIMTGVLYQMLPVILGARPVPARASRLTWWCFLVSTAVFTATLISGHDDLAPIGGIALTLAIAAITAHAVSVMRRATGWNVVAVYIAIAVGCLDAVAVMGAVLAVSLRTGMLADPLSLLAPKILLAVGGWLGLVLVGVSYQVVPLFNVSTVRPRWPRPVLLLLSTGLVLGVVALAADLAPPVRAAALVPYVAGAVLYVTDIVRLTRFRGWPAGPGITPVGEVAAAVVFLLTALVALPAAAGMQPWPQVTVTSALLGWAPLAISANGARIFPFLAWTRAGVPGAAPLAANRIPIRAGVGQLALLGLGWLLLEAGFLTRSGAAARTGGLLLLLGALAFPALIALALGGRRFRWAPLGPFTR
ncbi:MAG: hypothetical protein DLM65_09790 [Candidatus Aeolococcus gillhamiae]|uniref:Uncharacterized protein n=1 Tax=Candidatus Aeolococcus gillhamiae TaxID=3127015 RepID=A0A2W5Z3I8_9BACT|nr:MAG: hypothetical protein DLM65_09790 [Candidatus Dormibacter sp. RRmetagenome_bin12]